MNHFFIAKYKLLVLANIVTSIFLSISKNDLSIIIYIISFLLLGNIFLYIVTANEQSKKKTFYLFHLCFLLYAIFTIITHHFLIVDPARDFFLQRDQLIFYEGAIKVAKAQWGNLFSTAFVPYYSEYPLAAYLFGILAKIGSSLGVTDLLLFFKFHVILLASLISPLIHSVLYELGLKGDYKKEIIVFSLLSYIFVYSGIFTRDIHIVFLYTLILFITTKQSQRFRYPILLILALVTALFRLENGIFAFVFIYLRLYTGLKKSDALNKVMTVFLILLTIVLGAAYAYSTMLSAMINSATRMEGLSSPDSMYSLIRSLPIPLNVIAIAFYSQILPFPLWSTVTKPDGGYFLLTSLATPIYWLYIWGIIGYSYLIKKEISKPSLYLFYIAALYVLVTSFTQVDNRRIMAVYPILLIVYIVQKEKVSMKSKKNIFAITTGVIILLHLSYLIIK